MRTAGKTLRLYTDGVFHSQFNPNHAVTGGVWDALMLPAFFYPAESWCEPGAGSGGGTRSQIEN